jgi:hypothetical protein
MYFMWRVDARMARYAWWRKWRGMPEPMPISPAMEMIMRETLAQLNGKQSFLSAIDKSMPTGGTIRVRLPQQYVKRT